MSDAPELPETLDEVYEIDSAYELSLPDGSVWEMPGTHVLAVYMKYGRETWDEWTDAAVHEVEVAFENDRVPQKFFDRSLEADETEMADIAQETLYYVDLRVTLMQIALTAIADEDDDEPVEVIGLTGEGTRTYDVADGLGGEADE